MKMPGYIYFLFKEKEIVYIGYTYQLEKRINQHRIGKNKKDFDDYKFIEVDYYTNKGLDIEARLIQMFKPKLNSDYATRRVEHWAARLKKERLNKELSIKQ